MSRNVFHSYRLLARAVVAGAACAALALLLLVLAGCGGGDVGDDEGLQALGPARAPYCPPAEALADFMGPLELPCWVSLPPPLPLLAPLPTRPQPVQAAG